MSTEEISGIRGDIKQISDSHSDLKIKYIEISGRLMAAEDLHAERYINLNDKMDRLLEYQKTQNGNVARIKKEFSEHKEKNTEEINEITLALQPIKWVSKRPVLFMLMLAVIFIVMNFTITKFGIHSTKQPIQNSIDSIQVIKR